MRETNRFYYKINTLKFYGTPFSNQVSATEPSSTIGWGESLGAGFSAVIIKERDCETV